MKNYINIISKDFKIAKHEYDKDNNIIVCGHTGKQVNNVLESDAVIVKYNGNEYTPQDKCVYLAISLIVSNNSYVVAILQPSLYVPSHTLVLKILSSKVTS